MASASAFIISGGASNKNNSYSLKNLCIDNAAENSLLSVSRFLYL